MLEGLDNIDWEKLEHAYGEATDVPELIRALTSKKKKVLKDTRWTLYGNIFHQGSRYEATTYAVPFFYELLEIPKVVEKEWIIEYLLSLAIGYHDYYLPFGTNIKIWKDQLESEKEKQKRGEYGDSVWGEDYAKENQQYYIKSLTDNIKTYNAVLEGLPKLYPFLDSNDENIRLSTTFVLAWFREEAKTSREKIRLMLSKETSINNIANSLISIALLSSYMEDTSDEELFESYFNEKYHKLIRAAAAIALATIFKTEVKIEVVRILIDSLIVFSTEKESKNRKKLEIKLNWNDGDIIGYISEILSYCGQNKPDLVLPPIVEILKTLNTYQALTITNAALKIAFHDTEPKGEKWTLEELSKYSLMVLEVLADEPNLWGIDGSIFANFAEILESWALPSNIEDMRKFLEK